MINIDDLTRKLAPKAKEIPIGDSGESLYMVPMSTSNRLTLAGLIKNDNSDVTRYEAMAIVYCSVDLSLDDVEKVMTWPADLLSSLAGSAYAVSGLGDSEEAEKN